MSLSSIKVNNQQIIGIDEEPTSKSDNLSKSGSVFDQVDCLFRLNTGNIELNSIEEGVFLDINGNRRQLSDYNINNYNIIGNTTYEVVRCIYVEARTGGSSYFIFYDEYENIVGKYKGLHNEIYDVVNTFSYIHIPEKCTHFSISYVSAFGCKVNIINLSQRLNNIESNISSNTISITNANNNIAKIDQQVNGTILYESTENGVYYNANYVKYDLDVYSIDNYNIYNTNITSIHIKCRNGTAGYFVFFDMNDNVLVGYPGNDSSIQGINVDNDYNVPVGCTHFGVSYVNTFECIVTANGSSGSIGLIQRVNEIESKISEKPYAGKKIGLLGDSIASNGGFIIKTSQLLGCTYKNVAIGGWYYGDCENKSVYKQVNGISPANKSLDGDEDLIIIFAGTNDFGHDFPIGVPYTIVENGHKSPSTDVMTMCGGIVKTIQTLYDKYNGYIPIIICTPLQRKMAGGGDYGSTYGGSWDMTKSQHLYMDDYIEGIRKTATYYGIPVCDFYNMNMNPNIDAANTKYFADGLHPNTAGHNLMGEHLARFILNNVFDI